MSVHRYAAVGLAVVLVAMMFVVFADGESRLDPDYTGIATDVKQSTSGYTFNLVTVDGTMRCYSVERPVTLGYYGVVGTFSGDGTMFFVSTLICLDRRGSSQ